MKGCEGPNNNGAVVGEKSKGGSKRGKRRVDLKGPWDWESGQGTRGKMGGLDKGILVIKLKKASLIRG